jgi:hypothetical protein
VVGFKSTPTVSAGSFETVGTTDRVRGSTRASWLLWEADLVAARVVHPVLGVLTGEVVGERLVLDFLAAVLTVSHARSAFVQALGEHRSANSSVLRLK